MWAGTFQQEVEKCLYATEIPRTLEVLSGQQEPPQRVEAPIAEASENDVELGCVQLVQQVLDGVGPAVGVRCLGRDDERRGDPPVCRLDAVFNGRRAWKLPRLLGLDRVSTALIEHFRTGEPLHSVVRGEGHVDLWDVADRTRPALPVVAMVIHLSIQMV